MLFRERGKKISREKKKRRPASSYDEGERKNHIASWCGREMGAVTRGKKKRRSAVEEEGGKSSFPREMGGGVVDRRKPRKGSARFLPRTERGGEEKGTPL